MLSPDLEKPVIRTARDAATLCEPHFAGCMREKLLVLHLDDERRLLALAAEEGGGADHIDMPMRAILADAIRHGSTGLILAHCHPSGDSNPSDADIAVTRRLAELTKALGITLYDHLIFGSDCRSFRAMGLL